MRKSKNYDAQQISSIEYGTGACIQSEDQCPEPVSGLLLDAAGLSQKDLAYFLFSVKLIHAIVLS